MEKTFSRYLVFIIACTISITSALPHIYGYFKYQSLYTPFNLYEKNQYQRDELYAYSAQVQQILKGHLVGDSYIWEGKDRYSPFFSEFMSVLPVAALCFLLGSTSLGFIIADFFFPTLLFLLIFYQLKKNYHYLISLTAASSVIFIPFFSVLVPFFSKWGYLWTGTVTDPIFITRTPHPQISLIYLFVAIFTITSALHSKKTTRLIPVATISAIGLYSSIFVSSTILLATLLLAPFLLKNSKKGEVLIAFLIFSVISLPWIINFIMYNDFLQKTDFLLRASYQKELLFPRQLRYIVFAIVFFLFSKKPIAKTITSFALSAGILMDFHQILLGRSIDADHWITRVIAPVATLAIFLAFGSAIKKNKRSKLILSVVLILVVSISIYFQIKWIDLNRNLLVPNQFKTQIFEQIKSVTIKDDVIASTSVNLNQFISGSTGRYVYIGPLERALLDSKEQFSRICDVYLISEKMSLTSNPDQLLELEISFQKWKLGKIIDKNQFIKECLNKDKTMFHKIDYVVDEKPNGSYELIKYGQ